MPVLILHRPGFDLLFIYIRLCIIMSTRIISRSIAKMNCCLQQNYQTLNGSLSSSVSSPLGEARGCGLDSWLDKYLSLNN